MKCRSLALIPLAASLLGTPATPEGSNTNGELLTPGPALERSIASGESRVYRVEVTDAPLLVTVEQRGIDLVVEAQGPGGPGAMTTNAENGRWGPEVLLLPAGTAATYRLEVRPDQRGVVPGSYSIQVEALAAATPAEERRIAALTAMSHAGQLTAGPPAARPQALAAYREALAAWRVLGERRWEAECLQAIAVLQKKSGDLKSAVETYEEVLPIWRSLAATEREASVLRALGTNRMLQGELEPARQALERSVALWQSLGERFDEAVARSELCGVQHAKGFPSAALACYEEARALFREVGDSSQELRVLNNLGGIYDLLGDADSALGHYEQALTLQRAQGDRQNEANTLINVAVIHSALGDWQEALRIYDQARAILSSLGDLRMEAALLNNVGFTYLSAGEPQQALGFLEQNLRLNQQIGARRDELNTLNNLGATWRKLGDLKRALDLHQRALELATALADSWLESITRLDLAEIQLEKGDASAALREIDPALAILREKGLQPAELRALQLRGRALLLAGRAQEALPVIQEVLARRRTLRDRAGEAEILYSLAAAERSLGTLAEARTHAEAAVARVEELRTGFVRADLRAAFLASRRRAYSLLIDLLMDRRTAHPPGDSGQEALAVSEQARARGLLDALYAGNHGHPGSGVPAELLARRQALRYRLGAKADQQLRQSGEPSGKLEQEIEALLAELDGVEGEVRRYDPQYAAFIQPRPIAVEEIGRMLDPGTLLLEYSLGEERSYLWAVSPEGLRSFDLPSQRVIEDLARRAYSELSKVEAGSGRRPQAVAALSRILLQPVWKDAVRARRLAVVPDGALNLLPFTALPVPAPGQSWDAPGGGTPLLASHEVVYLPSATTLAAQRQRLERRPPATQWAAVLADPVFAPDDPRLAGPAIASRTPRTAAEKEAARGSGTRSQLPLFERLPASQREATDIARLAPAGQVRLALAFAATRESVLAGDFRSYRVVHFATHGIADTRNPELSGLVLSLVDTAGHAREGFLRLADIYGLDLGADLVVLSGCRTALGKEVRGEGLMGITRGFLYAGVPRVVASLWKVEDRTSAELMSRFYRAMWVEKLTPAAALREAQLSLRREPRHRPPYSWAGFVLQGDWR